MDYCSWGTLTGNDETNSFNKTIGAGLLKPHFHMASCRDDGYDLTSTGYGSTSWRQTRQRRDPTAKCRTDTVTEISDRLVDKFLAMPCEAGYSMKLVIGPKKCFQATAIPLEEDDVEERLGPAVKQQLYQAQKSRQEEGWKTMARLMEEQKRVKDAIPRSTVQLAGSNCSSSSGSRVSSSKDNGQEESRKTTRSGMANSLWSLGSSTSL